MRKWSSRKWDFVLCVLGVGLVGFAFALYLTVSGSSASSARKVADGPSPSAAVVPDEVYPVSSRPGAAVASPTAGRADGEPGLDPVIAARVGEASLYTLPHMPGELVAEFNADVAKELNRTRLITREIDLLAISAFPELTRAFSDLEVTSIRSVFSGRLVEGLDRLFQITYASPVSTRRAAIRLASCGGVVTARPNGRARFFTTPNDPRFSQQWGLNHSGNNDIDAPEAWEYTTGEASILVGIVDSGIDLNHEDIKPNLWTNPGETPNNGVDDDGNGYIDDVHGWSAVTQDGNVMDQTIGHGTFTSSIACGKGNNGKGIAGVAWGCKIVVAKITSSWDFDMVRIANGIKYGADAGVHVLNVSAGGRADDQAVRQAVDYAVGKGVFICSASGNEGTNMTYYPGGHASVINVGAINQSGGRWTAYGGGSNYGTSVDVCAPGAQIVCAKPGGYTTEEGTSVACPFVAGVAALVLSANGGLSAGQVFTIIKENVKQVSASGIGGLVSAKLAVDAAADIDPPPPPPPPPPKKSGCSYSYTAYSGGSPGALYMFIVLLGTLVAVRMRSRRL